MPRGGLGRVLQFKTITEHLHLLTMFQWRCFLIVSTMYCITKHNTSALQRVEFMPSCWTYNVTLTVVQQVDLP